MLGFAVRFLWRQYRRRRSESQLQSREPRLRRDVGCNVFVCSAETETWQSQVSTQGTGIPCWLTARKKCGSGQPPEPHLLREFRPLPAPPMAEPRALLPAPQRATGSQLRRCSQHSKVHLHPIAPTGCDPAMRDRSEEAATPGCPRRLHALGTARQFTLGKTAAEPALRDHWQRVVHACSDCTF